MNDDREQAIAEVVEAIGAYDRGDTEFTGILPKARKLADIENPPLPDEIEVLVSRYPERDVTDFPDGWGYLYRGDSDAVNNIEGAEFYRCRLTPLERI